MKTIIEVRLIEPRGALFLSDDWVVDEGGYVLRKPAIQQPGQKARALEGEPVAHVPQANVMYALEYPADA